MSPESDTEIDQEQPIEEEEKSYYINHISERIKETLSVKFGEYWIIFVRSLNIIFEEDDGLDVCIPIPKSHMKDTLNMLMDLLIAFDSSIDFHTIIIPSDYCENKSEVMPKYFSLI